jgi:hypothetical protein
MALKSLKSFFVNRSEPEAAGITSIGNFPKSWTMPIIPMPELSTPIRGITYYDQTTDTDYKMYVPWRRTFLGM